MDFAVDAVKMLVVDDDKDSLCARAVNHLIVSQSPMKKGIAVVQWHREKAVA